MVIQLAHDSVELKIAAGRGGDGIVSFRREAYTPKGGPDGGDGGQGGDVVLIADSQLSTLIDLYHKKIIKAQDGLPGQGQKRSGKSGEDIAIKLPIGCEIYQRQEDQWLKIAEILQPHQRLVLAKGGRGGWGNWHFASATRQAPRFANPGKPGQSKQIRIVLKLLADVGLVGLPNVGKSSLLAKISNARPKIADYPFTTLTPNLGVVKHKGKQFVVADIPGLVQDAWQGKGLGDRFLQHVERTKIIVHLIDSTSKDIAADFKTIQAELKQYSPKLLKKSQVLVLTKADLNSGVKFRNALPISTVTGSGVNKLLDKVIEKL